MVFAFYTVLILFLILSFLLIMLMLIQKGRGGGLTSAFGGAGGNTAFGSKTGDVLTWATSICFGLFIVLAVTLNLLASHIGKSPPAQAVQTSPLSSGGPSAPGTGAPIPTPAPAR